MAFLACVQSKLELDAYVSSLDEGLQNRRGNVGMIEAAEGVTNVMEQRADNVFLVFTAAMGAGRGLQRMGHAIDRETTVEIGRASCRERVCT